MEHVMVDLETLGTNQDSVFVSIGACMFDPDRNEIGENFYQNIDWNDALKTRRVTGDTIKWWMKQSADARNAACAAGEPLKEVLKSFGQWFMKGRDDRKIWGNGATFDVSMLENAYMSEFGLTPWKFWNVRDMRTIVDIAQGMADKDSVKFIGTPHNALHDATHQARQVTHLWRRLRGPI
jgi:hypothetical protein